MLQILKYVILIVAGGYSAYTDYKYFKIKNYVTVPLMATGIVLAFIDRNIKVWESLLGIILPFLLCLIFYIAKMLKAGDVKLFMSVGATMGYKWILNCMAASILAGGVIAVAVVIKRRCFLKRMKKLFEYFKNFILSGVFVSYENEIEREGVFPFAVSIFAGIIITVILEAQGKYLFINI